MKENFKTAPDNRDVMKELITLLKEITSGLQELQAEQRRQQELIGKIVMHLASQANLT
jgi:hypothetical protein